MNTRWKGIQSVAALAQFLELNPGFIVVDTGDRESRYQVRSKRGSFISTVDGRSARALAAAGKLVIRHAGLSH